MTARHRPSLLHCLAGGLAASVLLLGVPRASYAQPPAIAGLYEELRMAIETEDSDALVAQFAPLMQLEASVQGGWLTTLMTMFNQRENIAVEMRFDEFQVVGPKAFVLVTWAFSGKTTDTGDAWSQTTQHADTLIQKGARWQLLGSDEVDPEATRTRLNAGQFADAASGLELSAPQDWRVYVTTGQKAVVTALSPDLAAELTWMVVDLPGTFTAEQLVRGQEDAITKLAPTIGLQFRDASSGPDTLSGRPAYRVRRVVVPQDSAEIYSDMTYCIVGSTLYLCVRAVMPPSAYPTYEQTMDRAVASTKIVEVQAAELPPEAGRIEDGKYINDVYGCEITGPPGWDTKIGQGRFALQVTMSEPGGESSLTLGMIEVPTPDLTAQAAVVGDDNLTSQAFDGFKLTKQGETKIGDLAAYESVSTFDFGGQARQRRRVYLVDGNRLFFMFADAVPADKWAKLSPLFDGTFKSFRLIEAKPPQ
jgi:hypothetical protein